MEKASGCVNTSIRLLCYLFVALVVIALPLSILSNNTLRTLLSVDDIRESVVNLLISKGGIRDQLTSQLISEAWAEQRTSEGGEALEFLTDDDTLRIAALLFPNPWVSDQVSENLGNLLLWFETEKPSPVLKINLVPLQEYFNQGGSNRIAKIVVDSWPQCTVQQARQLERVLQDDTSGRFEFCKPEGELYQRLVDYADQRLQQYNENLPTEIPLLGQLNSNESYPTLEEFRRAVLRLILILNILRPLHFLFLGLIMTFASRSWRDLGTWWGIPLSLGAMLVLFFVILARGVGENILLNSIYQGQQVPAVQEPVVDSLWDLITKILNRSAIQAIFTGILGFVFFLIPRLSKKKPKEEVQPSKSEEPLKEVVEDIPPPPQVEPFDPDELESSEGNS
jgi:hypothetical protein